MHYRTHAPRRTDTKAACDTRAGESIEMGSVLVITEWTGPRWKEPCRPCLDCRCHPHAIAGP